MLIMNQVNAKLAGLSPSSYFILGLSVWPVIAVALKYPIPTQAKAVSMVAGFVIGLWLVFRWLFTSQKPSWNRACNCGLLFVGYWVWYCLWWFLTTPLPFN